MNRLNKPYYFYFDDWCVSPTHCTIPRSLVVATLKLNNFYMYCYIIKYSFRKFFGVELRYLTPKIVDNIHYCLVEIDDNREFFPTNFKVNEFLELRKSVNVVRYAFERYYFTGFTFYNDFIINGSDIYISDLQYCRKLFKDYIYNNKI